MHSFCVLSDSFDALFVMLCIFVLFVWLSASLALCFFCSFNMAHDTQPDVRTKGHEMMRYKVPVLLLRKGDSPERMKSQVMFSMRFLVSVCVVVVACCCCCCCSFLCPLVHASYWEWMKMVLIDMFSCLLHECYFCFWWDISCSRVHVHVCFHRLWMSSFKKCFRKEGCLKSFNDCSADSLLQHATVFTLALSLLTALA